MELRKGLALGCLALILACGGGERGTHDDAAATHDTDAATFDQVIDNLTQTYFTELPETATYFGVPADLAPEAKARLTDRSPEAEAARRERMETILASLNEVDPDGLDRQRRITRETLTTLLDGALAPAREVAYGTLFGDLGVWFLPYVVNQNSGPTVATPALLNAQHHVTSAQDAEDYLSRLASYGAMADGVLAKLRHDVELGASPPDFIIEKAQGVITAFAATPSNENILYTGFVQKLADAKIEEAEKLSERALALLESEVLPGNRRIHDYLESIRADAPHDAGLWRLPQGAALYRAMIRHMIDFEMSPEEIHQLGLDEVDRILGEMDAILSAQGYEQGTVAERITELRAEERFSYPDSDEGRTAILDDIRERVADAEAWLPDCFGTLPQHGLEVRRVPVFSQDSAPGAYYDSPAADGSQPGIYWINLRSTAAWSKLTIPTLTHHEAIPGHHMQASIALDQDEPLISTIIFSNPASEGWALYVELLAAEMGAYAGDPFGDLGRLAAELHRAIRLVVDTGMHAMKWSREESIDYMVETSGIGRPGAVSETERYVVWPGQALGYKIGMLKIQALRAEAEQTLGDGFDIREFHDNLLRVSSAALPVIESEMRVWVESKR